MTPDSEFPNLPRESAVIKRAFTPKLDALLLFDYSAIELRILAYYVGMLGDISMAEEFRQGLDPHTETAKGMYQKDVVTDLERQAGKVLSFSIVYGGGTPTLIRQGVAKDFPEAQKILKSFHAARPGIGLLQNAIKKRLDQRGFLTTMWGRHLHPRSEHSALNALIQGCAADLMKQAMRKTYRWSKEHPEMQSHLVNVVHDELIFDCPLNELETMRYTVPILMDDERISKVVPIETDCELSLTNWAEKQSFEEVPLAV